jgi:hypothetical protein
LISRGYLLITQTGRSILSLKAQVGGPEAQDDAARSPATTFHRFRELPAEIRVMIWKLVLQTPGILRLDDDNPTEWAPFINRQKPPACAQACRESRAIFKAEAKQLFGPDGGIYKSLWFSPSTDIVYWEKRMIIPLGQEVFVYFNDKFPDVQKLAVDWPGKNPMDLEVLFEITSNAFPGCKRLIIVMEHLPLPDGDVSFTKVKNENEMQICLEEDWCYWGEIQRGISARFPLHGKQEMPSIECMEVTSVRK